jgi:hypothetical protein
MTHMMRVSQYACVQIIEYSCFMLLIKFLFRVQIIELENTLSQVVNELKRMKEEVAMTNEEARKKKEIGKNEEDTKRSKETIRTWWPEEGRMVVWVAPRMLLLIV